MEGETGSEALAAGFRPAPPGRRLLEDLSWGFQHGDIFLWGFSLESANEEDVCDATPAMCLTKPARLAGACWALPSSPTHVLEPVHARAESALTGLWLPCPGRSAALAGLVARPLARGPTRVVPQPPESLVQVLGRHRDRQSVPQTLPMGGAGAGTQ